MRSAPPSIEMWIRLGLISVAILAVALLMASGRPGTSLPISIR